MRIGQAMSRIAMHAVAAALVALCLSVEIAAAWDVGRTNPLSRVQAAQIGAASGVGAQRSSAACETVAVTWSAAANATRYHVDRTINAGATWTRVASDVSGTSWTDAAAAPGDNTVRWRVTPTRAGTSWTGPSAQSGNVSCDAPIDYNLTATNPPDSVVLEWNVHPDASGGYAVMRKIGSGSWQYVAQGVTATTWTDSTAHNVGEQLQYRVRAMTSGGQYDFPGSDIVTISSWQGTTPGTGGVSVSRTMLGDWGGSYQARVTITNNNATALSGWQVTISMASYPFNGTPGSMWGAPGGSQTVSYSGTTWIVSGGGTIQPGASINFTYSATRTGDEPIELAPAQGVLTITGGPWGSSYNGSISVTTNSPEPIAWSVTFRRTDPVFDGGRLWPNSAPSPWGTAETVSFDTNTWVLQGTGSNKTIQAGQTISFGFGASFTP